MYRNFKYILIGLLGVTFISFLITFIWVVYSSPPERNPSDSFWPVSSFNQKDKIGEKEKLSLIELKLINNEKYNAKNSKYNRGIDQVITPATEIVREYHYLECGHVMVGLPRNDPALVGLTLSQLSMIYTPSDGWEVIQDGSNRVILRLNLEELCPKCVTKRHLGVIDGKVAIFYGPAGYQGALDRLTNLSISKLPLDWQDAIRAGILEFKDIEALTQALDSLDEFF